MNVQRFLYFIDGISTWVGNAAAWLIILLKIVISIAGGLVMPQGIGEVVRCVVCLQTGEWPGGLRDVAEIDVIEEQLAHSEYVDEESRKIAIERAHEIDEAARQRGMGGDMKT